MSAARATFQPTCTEIRQVRDLARWCEEAAFHASCGSPLTINGEPSGQIWSRCAFGIATDVAARGRRAP
jgi:hypothetical protein